ncbi:MAG TPA: HigA family addiction module antitoxin [Blastocatellia bacterium]|nr:HigA family addiction module antitoxin [Blastocatellia bacterium]
MASNINRRIRPVHPGEALKEILPDSGLTQAELANLMRVSRRTVNQVLQQKRDVTVDTAMRLARVFNTTPQLWLNMQQAVDIWDAEQQHKAEYGRIKPLKASHGPSPV